jgi:hypothetical protein
MGYHKEKLKAVVIKHFLVSRLFRTGNIIKCFIYMDFTTDFGSIIFIPLNSLYGCSNLNGKTTKLPS